MAPWGDAKLFVCFLFITCCCTVIVAQIPMDCCLTVKNKTVEKAMIGDYYLQTSRMGCSIDATILVTRRGKQLCVPSNEPWVQKVMKHVDDLQTFCRKQRKSPRCKGVKHD